MRATTSIFLVALAILSNGCDSNCGERAGPDTFAGTTTVVASGAATAQADIVFIDWDAYLVRSNADLDSTACDETGVPINVTTHVCTLHGHTTEVDNQEVGKYESAGPLVSASAAIDQGTCTITVNGAATTISNVSGTVAWDGSGVVRVNVASPDGHVAISFVGQQ